VENSANVPKVSPPNFLLVIGVAGFAFGLLLLGWTLLRTPSGDEAVLDNQSLMVSACVYLIVTPFVLLLHANLKTYLIEEHRLGVRQFGRLKQVIPFERIQNARLAPPATIELVDADDKVHRLVINVGTRQNPANVAKAAVLIKRLRAAGVPVPPDEALESAFGNSFGQ
jgi:hypothetical protein